jgi:hypothetical protein
MNIISAKYTSNDDAKSIKLVADGVTMYVPLDPANTDYQAILEWVKIGGNTIAEAD